MKPANEIRRENLKALARQYGGVARLAERLDRASAQVSQWINASRDSKTGKPRTISDRSARFIEHRLGLPENWLDHDHSAPAPNTEPGPPIRARVPLISWTTAGNWAEVVDNFAPGDAEDWVVTTANVGPHAFALRIRGDSMAPTIADGALVVVDPDTQYRHRSVVIVRQNHDSEATCKRLIQEGSRWHLAPDNPRYPVMEMSPDARIVGVVRQVVVDLE